MRRLINSALGRIARMLPPTEIPDGYETPELIEMIAFRPGLQMHLRAGRTRRERASFRHEVMPSAQRKCGGLRMGNRGRIS